MKILKLKIVLPIIVSISLLGCSDTKTKEKIKKFERGYTFICFKKVTKGNIQNVIGTKGIYPIVSYSEKILLKEKVSVKKGWYLKKETLYNYNKKYTFNLDDCILLK